MKRFLLAGAYALVSVAASAQATNVVKETNPDRQLLYSVDNGIMKPSTLPVAPMAEVKKTLQQPTAVLLDVRTPEEFNAGHLTGARNLDFRATDFRAQLARLDPSKAYVLYCRSGSRSSQAGLIMHDKGFKNVLNAGAYEELKKQDVRK